MVSLSRFITPRPSSTFFLSNTLPLINREWRSAICDPGPAVGCRDGRRPGVQSARSSWTRARSDCRVPARAQIDEEESVKEGVKCPQFVWGTG
jgi:hypothetical protein